MEREQWICPAHACDANAWLVQQAPDNAELWSLECRLTGASFTVAASYPVCPRCGTTLCAISAFAHDRRSATVLEDGPVLDFVRSLR